VPTPANRRFVRALSAMDAMVYDVIRSRRASANPPANDLLAMFMEARDEETGEAMSERQLRDEVMTMVSAGHETTANALTWTFYLLSEHPEKAARLEEEVDRVLGGRVPGIEDLPKLVYTEAAIKESMRLLPPVWMIARSALEDDEILGVHIPRRAMVFLPAWIVHKDPRFWEKAKEFYPERWMSADIEHLPKHAYFPFAGGPRVCIGNSFAMMEAKLLLAMIAQRNSLRLVPGHPVVPTPTITLRPKFGMKMTLRERPKDQVTGS
jgi:cytochrome P450